MKYSIAGILPDGEHYASMSPHVNVTLTSEKLSATGRSLLWLPYVTIAVVCMVALGINFWFYHRKRQLHHERKLEVQNMRDNVRERRFVLNIVQEKASSYLLYDKHFGSYGATADVYKNPMQHSTKSHEIANL